MKIFKEFEGKTAFVTGAASGMGQAAAICFGGLGCRVAVAARNPKALETVQTIRENGGEAIFVECDVTDDDSVRKAIETTVKTSVQELCSGYEPYFILFKCVHTIYFYSLY